MANLIKRCDCACAVQTTPCECGEVCVFRIYQPQSGFTPSVAFLSADDAQDAIDNFVSNCLGYAINPYFVGATVSIDSFSATFSVDELTLAGSASILTGSGPGLFLEGCVNLEAGSTLTVACATDGDFNFIRVETCDGTLVDEQFLFSANGELTFEISAAGGYRIYCGCRGANGAGSVEATFSITSDMAISANTVVAASDEGDVVCV